MCIAEGYIYIFVTYNKNHRARQETPPFKLLGRVLQETPQITDAIAKVLDCLLELEGETLLLKTGHNSDIGLGEINLELTWISSP